ncbi:hypothetical protein PoB_001537300 [Plakobranchus ocellatus]|uniref:Uncharacterized protein n=1 Tax=Plakobranchus ocellatus TaxID=259542 RepID=A0AAV3Z300_9GAST|nr:hypothetical protein PoB_001537300 [Plakobranchus ocellatus]
MKNLRILKDNVHKAHLCQKQPRRERQSYWPSDWNSPSCVERTRGNFDAAEMSCLEFDSLKASAELKRITPEWPDLTSPHSRVLSYYTHTKSCPTHL